MAPSSPVYNHRCTLPDRTLWWGRASLYEDRIVIQGWTWRGRYRRKVVIANIDEIQWRPRPERPNLILHLDHGEVVQLRLEKGAGLWNAKLHDLLDESLLEGRSLPENGHSRQKDEQEEDQETT